MDIYNYIYHEIRSHISYPAITWLEYCRYGIKHKTINIINHFIPYHPIPCTVPCHIIPIETISLPQTIIYLFNQTIKCADKLLKSHITFFFNIQTKLHLTLMVRCQRRNHFQNKKDLSMVQELHGKNGNLKLRLMECWMLMLTLLWILSQMMKR